MIKQKYTKLPKSIQDQVMILIATGQEKETITKPYSGESADLEPIAAAVYKYIIRTENVIESANQYDFVRRNLKLVYGKTINGLIKDFDNARYWFMKNFIKEYMTLLD